MEDYPLIETDRIRLRKPAARDISRITRYADNPGVADMTLNIPYPYSEEDAITWLNMAYEGFRDRLHYVFAIALKSSDEFIGGVGLRVNERFNRAELGYWLGEPFWNNGYATEAIGEVLRFGFEEAGIHKIFATHLLNNPASGRVMIKNGMIKEGELKEHIRKKGTYLSVVQYRLTKEEYLSRNKT